MAVKATAVYEVTAWDEEPVEDPDKGPKIARAAVSKAFKGDLEGESRAELLMARSDGGEGYVAIEHVSGLLGGRHGTFVLQHGATRGEGVEPQAFARVVPGSGTGELEGLRGSGAFRHDDGGAVLRLDYEIG
jgi:hypothetical protein